MSARVTKRFVTAEKMVFEPVADSILTRIRQRSRHVQADIAAIRTGNMKDILPEL